jgi:hypothetical protein
VPVAAKVPRPHPPTQTDMFDVYFNIVHRNPCLDDSLMCSFVVCV